MIACVCAAAEAGDPAYLDDAVEIPWVMPKGPRCAEAGPHFHRCSRAAGHSGRHLEAECLAADLWVAMAVWDD